MLISHVGERNAYEKVFFKVSAGLLGLLAIKTHSRLLTTEIPRRLKAKKVRINALTPYNLIFVQKVELDGKTIYIPRRCMHWDNPPCVRGCPFGALSKQLEGYTVIDHSICFGVLSAGMLPLGIPQRQAGVGMYLKLAPRHPLWL